MHKPAFYAAPQRRWMRTAYRVGLAASLFLLVVALASIWWRAGWVPPYRVHAELGSGCVGASVDLWDGRLMPIAAEPAPFYVERNTHPLVWRAGLLNYTSAGPPEAGNIRPAPGVPPRYRQVMVFVPLWMPFAALALPTVVLWWLDRRRSRAGACPSCGYALAGLPAMAVCPECGTER